MEVYQSSKTAAEMEFALGAIPSIGANKHWFIGDVDTGVSAEGLTPYVGTNGNWWVGETDTGIFAGGVKVEGAKVGQTIVVKAVDENGVPTEWEAANLVVPDEYVVLLNKVFSEDTPVGTPWGGEYRMTPDCHWWDRSADGELYKLETIKVLIHTPATASPTNGSLKVYIGRDHDTDASAGNAWIGTSPIWDNASFPGTTERWLRYEYDLRNKNATFVNNATTNPIWARTTPSDHVGVEKLWANTKWLRGVAIQFYGTMPAGTELFIYGKKINENNPLPPAWEVSK